MEFTYEGVNEAFLGIIGHVNECYKEVKRDDSRNGPVLKFPEPVTVTFTNPRNRVLINTGRDCNPFFHMFESFWMLAGSNDVPSLSKYASKIGQFSDDGKTFNGAYGYRWRQAAVKTPPVTTYSEGTMYGDEVGITGNRYWVDQLKIIIERLKKDPTDRRSVLQMWNVEDDLLKTGTSKDVCCNLSCMFLIRSVDNGIDGNGKHTWTDHLDMTVTNRSNDLVWGLFGANVVHFSYLLEYMATQIGVETGKQIHFTNNLHIYTESNSGFHPNKWLEDCRDYKDSGFNDPTPMDVVTDRDLRIFIDANGHQPTVGHPIYESDYMTEVVQPVMNVHRLYKAEAKSAALKMCPEIGSPDWRLACSEWIARRIR